jgi:hypothetical protein
LTVTVLAAFPKDDRTPHNSTLDKAPLLTATRAAPKLSPARSVILDTVVVALGIDTVTMIVLPAAVFKALVVNVVAAAKL